MTIGSITKQLQAATLDDTELFIPIQIACDENTPDMDVEAHEPTLEELLATDPIKGGEALLACEGEVALKIHWIPHLPNAALSLIMQIEDAPELNEKRVKKWLGMQDGLVFRSLFMSKSGRWRPLCARSRPEQVVAILTGRLSKNEKQHLVECRHQYLPHMPPNLAVSALKVLNIQLTEEDKQLLLSSMQKAQIDEELVDWCQNAVPAKFSPLEHIRAYRAIIMHYPAKINASYVTAQHQRMSEKDRTTFRAEIPETAQTHFACFFKEPKQAKPQAHAAVKLRPIEPLFTQLDAQLKDNTLETPVSAIKNLFNNKNELTEQEQLILWDRVFCNRVWLSDQKLAYILNDIQYFERLFSKNKNKNDYFLSAVKILTESKNGKVAYGWYRLLDKEAPLFLVGILHIVTNESLFSTIVQAHWKSLLDLWKKEIESKNTTIEITNVIRMILKCGTLEILLDLFDLSFTDEFRKKYMHDNYQRITKLALVCTDPTTITRVLLLEVSHGQAFQDRDRTFAQKIMLRQIEYSGWSDTTADCFKKLIINDFDTNHCTSFMSPSHTGRTFQESSHFVCSFCPLQDEGEKTWRYNTLIHGWIEASIQAAKKAAAPDALKEFALQNLRNLVDCHPFTKVPYHLVRELAAITPHPLIASLITRAEARGCFTTDQANGLRTLVKTIPAKVDGSIIINGQQRPDHQPPLDHMIPLQKAMIAWQENPDATDYEQIKRAFFAAWRANPDMILADRLAEGLGEIISPNTQLWKKDDFDTFSQFLDLLKDNYTFYTSKFPDHSFAPDNLILTPAGMAATRYLRTLADVLSNGVRWKLHLGKTEERFTKHLEAFMQLFQPPFYLSKGRAHPELASESFHLLIDLTLQPLSTRDRLVKSLLELFEKNRGSIFFNLFLDLAFSKIIAVYEKNPTKDTNLLDHLARLVRDMPTQNVIKECCLNLLKRAVGTQ